MYSGYDSVLLGIVNLESATRRNSLIVSELFGLMDNIEKLLFCKGILSFFPFEMRTNFLATYPLSPRSGGDLQVGMCSSA